MAGKQARTRKATASKAPNSFHCMIAPPHKGLNAGARNARDVVAACISEGFAGALSGIMSGQSYLAAVSWLSPNKLGIGQLQPNARIQIFNKDAGDTVVYDAGVAYVIDGFNHRWHLNYRHVDNPGPLDEDSVQFGAQVQL